LFCRDWWRRLKARHNKQEDISDGRWKRADGEQRLVLCSWFFGAL